MPLQALFLMLQTDLIVFEWNFATINFPNRNLSLFRETNKITFGIPIQKNVPHTHIHTHAQPVHSSCYTIEFKLYKRAVNLLLLFSFGLDGVLFSQLNPVLGISIVIILHNWNTWSLFKEYLNRIQII